MVYVIPNLKYVRTYINSKNTKQEDPIGIKQYYH